MQTDLSSIKSSLVDFIKENLAADGVIFTFETPLEQLGLDSFSIIEIVLFIERTYNLELPDNALTKENVYSVDALSKCVHQYLSEK